ncbi:hypothetical protein K1719_041739 [Acacia pycnantha]|nr:hypothetical protein K1719_041739 [Acacia pycnantha]
MSVVGFDFGNESCIVAVARQRGIDVVLNDESKRETPAIVCFGDKQRFIGTAGAASTMMNPKNSISQIKRLIARQFSDPELQRDLKSLPFVVTEGPDGYPLIHRRAVLDAATIAGLHPLRLIHETTATALAYGIYKTDLPENDQLNVAFVDVGHASMQVCIAGFKKGQLKVLAHSFDRSLGGRDFDEVLFHHFSAKFKEEYKIDVFQNARACLRLRAACEKLKKMLSANPEAPLNIECLMDEKDALAEAGLTVEDVHMVEVIGSASRIPAINKILTEFFKKEPRRTMNASECVAKGCALQCAILSPTFKVREFQVNESFPFLISLSWKGSGPDLQENEPDKQMSTVVFSKGNVIPSIKALTFFRSETFSVDIQYADVSEVQAPPKISTYTIGPLPPTKVEKAKIKVRVRLNLHGIVSIDSATLLEEEEVEVPVVKVPAGESAKMDTDEVPAEAAAAAAEASAAPSSSNDADADMQDAKATADAPGLENGNAETGDKPVQMETDTKIEAPKKKVKKTNIHVTELVYGATSHSDVLKAVEKEFEMALQDRVMEETKEKKNAVEAYVYDMRNKLCDKYQDFVADSEREALTTRLQEVEDWLYEDGEDETKGVYVAKLEELKKQGDPIEERYKEYMERGIVINLLIYCINSYREAAMSNDSKFDHIDVSEKQKVLNECVEAEAWLREKQQQQDTLPKYANPVLLSAEVRKKAEAVDRFCKPIMTKPRPAKPATPEAPATPPPPPQGGEQQQSQGDANASDNADQAPPESTDEPMETDKSENSGAA